jgi:hypothetical protein
MPRPNRCHEERQSRPASCSAEVKVLPPAGNWPEADVSVFESAIVLTDVVKAAITYPPTDELRQCRHVDRCGVRFPRWMSLADAFAARRFGDLFDGSVASFGHILPPEHVRVVQGQGLPCSIPTK